MTRKCYNSANYYNFTTVYNNSTLFSPASYQSEEAIKTLADNIRYLSFSLTPYLPFYHNEAARTFVDTFRYWKDTARCYLDHKMGRQMDSIFYDPRDYYNFTYVKENHDYSLILGAGIYVTIISTAIPVIVNLVARSDADTYTLAPELLFLTISTVAIIFYDNVVYAVETLNGMVEAQPITDPNTDWI